MAYRSAPLVTAALLAGLFAASGPALGQGTGDPAAGEQIARTWCANCHVASDDQTTASPDVPTFRSLAEREDVTADGLSTFLVTPHPPMPDMHLTRDEIANVIAYIMSLADK